MDVQAIKKAVMFQTNNDADDLSDFSPYLLGYINEGYEKLVYAYAKDHISPSHETYLTLVSDAQEPQLPEWTHQAIVDYATWLVYRNGNASKQSRGFQFLQGFNDVMNQIRGGSATLAFTNIPT